MCEIATAISLASLAIGAGSAVASYQGQQASADASSQAQVDNYVRTVQESQAGYAQQVNQENRRLNESSVSDSNDLTKVAIERRKAQATARVAAGEAGVAGLSLDALLRDFDRSEAQYRDSVVQQREFDLLASKDTIRGFDSARKSRNNSARPQAVARPSFFGAALRVGGAALDSGVFNEGGAFGPKKKD